MVLTKRRSLWHNYDDFQHPRVLATRTRHEWLPGLCADHAQHRFLDRQVQSRRQGCPMHDSGPATKEREVAPQAAIAMPVGCQQDLCSRGLAALSFATVVGQVSAHRAMREHIVLGLKVSYSQTGIR